MAGLKIRQLARLSYDVDHAIYINDGLETNINANYTNFLPNKLCYMIRTA